MGRGEKDIIIILSSSSSLLLAKVEVRNKGWGSWAVTIRRRNGNSQKRLRYSKEKAKSLIIFLYAPLWSSGQSFWLQMQRSRVRFPALPDFLSSSGSGTGSTQSREVN